MGIGPKQIGWSQESNLLWQICKILDGVQGTIGTFTNVVPNTRVLTINGVSQDLSADRTWTVLGTAIGIVPSYSFLPLASSVPGEFFWAENSEGTQWLPGSFGGTYYNAGLYYSNGIDWTYMETPYQATQAEVDAGVNFNKFLTPLTFANASKWSTKQNNITLTTTGTNGPATLIGDILNIPVYTSSGGGGSTNLGYIASPIDGIVTSDTGTDATIPLVDFTNAGLLPPGDYASFLTRTQWMGTWTQQQYLPYQQVIDEGYLAIANTTTEERPAPQRVGEPFNIYNGTIGTTTAVAKQILFGNKYTFTENVFFVGWRINLVAGNSYVVYLVRDPDGAAIISQILQFVAQTSGWVELNAQSFIIESGNTYAALAAVSEPAVVPVTFNGNWNYVQVQNPTVPLNGQITQPRSVPSLLYVSNLDNALADRSAQLNSLNVGDLIQTSTNTWAIQSKSVQVGYFIFGVSPALLNVNLGVQDFTFEIKSTATLTYPLDPNYWGLNPVPVATVQGLLGIDIPYTSIVPNTTAYGIGLLVQNLVLSADWDIQAFNGIGGGGGNSSGGVPESRMININGNDFDLSSDREWRVAQADTGVMTFNGLFLNSATTIDVGGLTGYVINNESDPDNPSYTRIDYAGQINVPVPTVGSGPASYVLIGPNGVGGGTLFFQNTFPTSAERKARIWLGKVSHPAGTITVVINEPDYIISPQAFARDLFQVLGPYINDGVIAYPNGANLQVNITGGTIHGNGINFVADNTNPNELMVGPFVPMAFLIRTQTGAGPGITSNIVPGQYDVGGVLTPVGGGANSSTLQYIFAVPTVGFIIQPGQVAYASLSAAIAAIGRESFTIYPNLIGNAILIGVLAVNKSATNLSDTTQGQFFPADKFGQIIGATSGISTGTLQQAYQNSLLPQIIVSDALGEFTVQSGRASNASVIQGWRNIAGTLLASVTGNGGATFTSVISPDLMHLTGNESFTGTKSSTTTGTAAAIALTNNTLGGVALAVTNTAAGNSFGIVVTNSTGVGIRVASSSGTCFSAAPSGNGVGFAASTSLGSTTAACFSGSIAASYGMVLDLSTASALVGIRINNNTVATGKPFQYTKNAVERAFLNDAGQFSAQALIKAGGLSTEFLMADGTVATLTTTGSSGPATLTGGVLNIPNYAGGGGATNLSYTSSTTTGTVNSDTGTDAVIPAADGIVAGLLTTALYTTFNAKQNAITLTTTGSSGAATLIGDVLNIPIYSGGGGGISGSGTTNKVAKFTGATAVGDSNITDSGSAIILGVNTSITGIFSATTTGATKTVGISLTNNGTTPNNTLSVANTSTGRGVVLTNTNLGTALFCDNSGSGIGINVTNSSNGTGYAIVNNGSGAGFSLDNSATQSGFIITNSSLAAGMHIINSITGYGINIENSAGGGGGTGIIISNQDIGFGIDINNIVNGYGINITNGDGGRGINILNQNNGPGLFVVNQSSEPGVRILGQSSTNSIQVESDVNGASGIEVISTVAGRNFISTASLGFVGSLYIGYYDANQVFEVNQSGDVTANSFIKTGGLSTEYLMADGSVSLGGGGGGSPALTYNVQAGTTYTIVEADNGKRIETTNSATVTITIPSGLSAGFNCSVLQQGTGQVIFATSGTTLRLSSYEVASTQERWALVGIDRISSATEEYKLYGGLTSI